MVSLRPAFLSCSEFMCKYVNVWWAGGGGTPPTLHYAEKLDPISFKIGRLEGKWSILGTAPIFF